MSEHIVNANDADEISLKDIILKLIAWRKFLFSKRKTILIGSFIGATLGLIYSFVKKPVYTAVVSFALEDSRSGGGLGAYSGIASQFGLDIGSGNVGGVFAGDNLLELMKSRSMVQNALLTSVQIKGQSKTLVEVYIDFNDLRKSWQKDPQLVNVHFLPNADQSRFSLKQDSILDVIYQTLTKSNILVDKVDKKLSIITVTVKSKNELFSKYFAETLVNVVSGFYIETKTRKSLQNVTILQYQTDSVRRELNNAINGVATSVDINPNANPYRQILRTPSQHRQVDVQVNTAILAELVKNLEVAKVSLRNETPLIQIIDKPILPLNGEKFGKVKGLTIGFVLGFIISTLFLTVKKAYKTIMS